MDKTERLWTWLFSAAFAFEESDERVFVYNKTEDVVYGYRVNDGEVSTFYKSYIGDDLTKISQLQSKINDYASGSSEFVKLHCLSAGEISELLYKYNETIDDDKVRRMVEQYINEGNFTRELLRERLKQLPKQVSDFEKFKGFYLANWIRNNYYPLGIGDGTTVFE